MKLGSNHSEVLMAASADESRGRERSVSPEVQLSDDAEVLDAKVASIEEKIALCDVVVQDLLSVQRIVKEKGICDDSLVPEIRNKADFTL